MCAKKRYDSMESAIRRLRFLPPTPRPWSYGRADSGAPACEGLCEAQNPCRQRQFAGSKTWTRTGPAFGVWRVCRDWGPQRSSKGICAFEKHASKVWTLCLVTRSSHRVSTLPRRAELENAAALGTLSPQLCARWARSLGCHPLGLCIGAALGRGPSPLHNGLVFRTWLLVTIIQS